MGTIRFVLRTDKPDKSGLTPIQMIYQLSGQRKYYKTKQKLLQENWNADTQTAVYLDKRNVRTEGKEKKNEAILAAHLGKSAPVLIAPRPGINYENLLASRDISELNLKLLGLKKQIVDIENRFQLNKIAYSPEDVINALKEDAPAETKKQATSKQLFHFIDKYIADHQTTRKSSSLGVYRSLRNHLADYEKFSKRTITFEAMDYDFFNAFQKFLLKEGLNNTTIAKNLSTVKTFINYARTQGIPVTDKYKDFKIKKENLEVIALTNDEFETLFNLDLKGNKRLEQVRDVFCFSCATGLRYSDLKQLARVHINKDEIRLVVTKTSEVLTIPLNDYAKAILAKYKGMHKPLPVVSNQKLNAYLKGWDEKDATTKKIVHHEGLCEIAGINDKVEIVRFKGAERVVNTYPKYELIGMHTGRKTFVTLMLEKGASAEEVMSMTGHTDYKSFQRYVKITETRKKVVMQKAWKMEKNNLKAV